MSDLRPMPLPCAIRTMPPARKAWTRAHGAGSGQLIHNKGGFA